MADEFDDGVDEFSGIPDESVEPPNVLIASTAAIVIACAGFVYTVHRIGRDVLRHSPERNLHALPYVLLLDIVVAFISIQSLKRSHALEGSVPRAMSLGAVAISFFGIAIVSYSLYNFYVLVQQAHS
jgi:hypothetical protein